MSMTSKVNSTLRANIIRSLSIFPKFNKELIKSPVANPGAQYSLRAMQEATKKLVTDGTLVVTKSSSGKSIYRVATLTGGTAVAQAVLGTLATAASAATV